MSSRKKGAIPRVRFDKPRKSRGVGYGKPPSEHTWKSGQSGNPKGRPKGRKVAWQKTPSTRRREILVPDSMASQAARPIRAESRALLVASIARGRRWLDELTTDPNTNAETIAARERCSVRKVNMTISLAFLAPDLVKAAIDGRLPHGMGVARLCELPAEWSRQRGVLGLTAP